MTESPSTKDRINTLIELSESLEDIFILVEFPHLDYNFRIAYPTGKADIEFEMDVKAIIMLILEEASDEKLFNTAQTKFEQLTFRQTIIPYIQKIKDAVKSYQNGQRPIEIK